MWACPEKWKSSERGEKERDREGERQNREENSKKYNITERWKYCRVEYNLRKRRCEKGRERAGREGE